MRPGVWDAMRPYADDVFGNSSGVHDVSRRAKNALEEARDPGVPLAERLKFQSIVGSNLDEFFMVRVAGLKQMVSGNVVENGPDGLAPSEQLAKISDRAHAMVAEQYRNWREEIAPALGKAGVRILRPAELTADHWRPLLTGDE